MRSTIAAYILLPVVFGLCSVLWAVMMKPLAALAVLALFVAWNVWSGTRAHRGRAVNPEIAGGTR